MEFNEMKVQGCVQDLFGQDGKEGRELIDGGWLKIIKETKILLGQKFEKRNGNRYKIDTKYVGTSSQCF